MRTINLLKYAFVRTGKTFEKLGQELNVSPAYIAYIVHRMDHDTKHLLPETARSWIIQKAVKDLIVPELTMFSKNTDKVTISND